MAYTDKILPASLDGIPFQVQVSDFEGGRRTADHVFPKRDTIYSEDMGRSPSQFNVEGFVLGDDYFEQKEALLNVCQQPGAKSLVHPYFGSQTVICKSIKIREEANNGRIAKLSMLFIEAGSNVNPIISSDTQSTVLNSTKNTRLLADIFMGNRFDLSGASDFVRGVLNNDIVAFINDLESLSGELSSDVIGLINDVKGSVSSLILQPAILASNLNSVVTAINNISIDNALKISAKSIDKISSPISNDDKIQTNTQGILDAYTKSTMALKAMELLSNSDFTEVIDGITVDQSKSSILLQKEKIVDGIDDTILEIDETNDDVELLELIDGIIESKNLFISDIEARTGSLPDIQTIEVGRDMPVIAVAYDLYGDSTRDSEIIIQNSIKMPNTVLRGTLLEVRSE